MPCFDSLVAMLEARAEHDPEGIALRFLLDGEREEVSWTYATLDTRARSVAAALRAQKVQGAALLLYPPGLEYVAALFGCMYAGVIAVPAYPPDPSRLHRTLPRLKAILADCGATVALTTEAILSLAEPVLAELSPGEAIAWLATDTLDASRVAVLPADRECVAFLQYTSGSTRSPRGVVLTHGNLLHNLGAIEKATSVPEKASVVVWLPQYHDMGLIGGILYPIYLGCPVTFLSPLHFLQRPWRWLDAISRFQATYSPAPNFAYDLCVKKTTPEQRSALDLRAWRVSFNGAEPIRADTLRSFAEAFAPAGFRPQTLFPCYGLAEGTLMASGGVAQEPIVIRSFRRGSIEGGHAEQVPGGHPEAVELVGSGQSIAGQRLVIVDPQTRRILGEGKVGEIWLAGPSVAKGYWHREEETRDTFGARLADTNDGPLLRTGDLGFLLNGQLFVTGRIKDLVIVAGQNFYPQDLERCAEASHPRVRVGASAAFGVASASCEQAVLVLETDDAADCTIQDEIRRTVRAAVSREFGLALQDIVLVGRSAVPRTSSGKVQRHLCRQLYLEGSLDDPS